MSANNQITANRHALDDAGASSGGEVKLPLQLKRASEVDAGNDANAPLGATVDWVRKFLSRPHPDLGRAGPVCPFTPMALELDTIWLVEIEESAPDMQRMHDLIEQCRQVFMETEPREGPMAINKVIMVVFSAMSSDDAPWIDALQATLKPNFVDAGLMLGEFHSRNDTPGLRNEAFRPLRSPIPMLVIRHMVESDLPFLKREADVPDIRNTYLRSYLRQLGPTLRRTYFDQAVDGLVEAEIQLRAAGRTSIRKAGARKNGNKNGVAKAAKAAPAGDAAVPADGAQAMAAAGVNGCPVKGVAPDATVAGTEAAQ